MRYLIPVGSSAAGLPAVRHLEAAASRGVKVEVVLLNVQPEFNRRVSRFADKASRDRFRAERSRTALAGMVERLSSARICFRARVETGRLTERIAAVAKEERADKILMGVAPRPEWLHWLVPAVPQLVADRTDVPVTVITREGEVPFERYLVPVGVAGIALLAGLFLAAN